MSRRLRQEQEYFKQLKQEGEQEEDKLKKQQEKIFAPVEWAQLVLCFTIRDLVEKDYAGALELIKNEYLSYEVLSRNAAILEEEKSTKSFLDYVAFALKDSTSILATDTLDGTLAGVLMLRVINKSDWNKVFNRNVYTDGVGRKKWLHITTSLNRRVDIFKLYDCDKYLEYGLLCVDMEYRGLGVGFQLMRCGLEVAKSLKIPVACGIFTDHTTQRKASTLDFELIMEITYTNWLDNNNELIFDDPGAGNFTCALMAAIVPDEVPPHPDVLKKVSPADLKVTIPPRTRREKRAQLQRSIAITQNSIGRCSI